MTSKVIRVAEEGQQWYRRLDEPETHRRPGPSAVKDCWVPPKLKSFYTNNTPDKIAEKMNTTAQIGTDFHAIPQARLTGEPVEVPAHVKKMVDNWDVLAAENHIQGIESEIMLVSDAFGFGGTADYVCMMDDKEGNPKKYLVDFKTGYVGSSHAWSTAAYWWAYQEMRGEILGMAVISIHRDGRKGKVIRYNDPQYWFRGFIGVYQAWVQENYRRLKSLNWHWLDYDPIQTYFYLTQDKYSGLIPKGEKHEANDKGSATENISQNESPLGKDQGSAPAVK